MFRKSGMNERCGGEAEKQKTYEREGKGGPKTVKREDGEMTTSDNVNAGDSSVIKVTTNTKTY